jgi:hypothetical protein
MTIKPYQYDPSEWARSDASFAAARKRFSDSVGAWRQAGGYWDLGKNPSHWWHWRKVVSAAKHRSHLSQQVLPQWDAILPALKRKEDWAIEMAIQVLERDPFAHAAGYLKAKLMRGLVSVHLDQVQRSRLSIALARVVTRGKRMEFRESCRLARYIQDPELKRSLERLSADPNPDTAYAATYMLNAIDRGSQVQK